MKNEYLKLPKDFWTYGKNSRILKHGLTELVIFYYIQSCPHANKIGVYYLPIDYITFDIEKDKKEVSHALNNLCDMGFCTYDWFSNYIWVYEMASCNYGKLKPNDNWVAHLNKLYKNLPHLPYLNDFYIKYHNDFHLKKERENHFYPDVQHNHSDNHAA
jgi:hypothetical protein